jgi:peptidoglycan/xylan/chitin deacetylase (PgdA/CDA1 family)
VDRLTATLRGSGSGENHYEDAYGWQALDYHADLQFAVSGIYAGRSGDLSIYQLTNKVGTIHLWGTAKDVFLGDTTTDGFDFQGSFALQDVSGVLNYHTKSNRVTYIGFSLEQSQFEDLQPYHVRYYDTNVVAKPFVQVFVQLSSEWYFDEACDFPGSATACPFMITFDDGPIPGRTDSILSALDTLQVQGSSVRAGFFLVGEGGNTAYYNSWDGFWDTRMGNLPDCYQNHNDLLVRLAQGHVLGNHTQHHADFDRWERFNFQSRYDFIKSEIQHCDVDLRTYLPSGSARKMFRPPYLQWNSDVSRGAADLGYKVIWAELLGDYWPALNTARDLKRRANAVLGSWNYAKLGPCVLDFHDNQPATFQHIGEIISYLRDQGYTLVHFDPDVLPNGPGAGVTPEPEDQQPLKIQVKNPNQIMVKWPITDPSNGGFLEASASLYEPLAAQQEPTWVAVTNQPVVEGVWNTLTFDFTNRSGFFRIHSDATLAR